MHPEVFSIFVYGTLQRGEEREPMWPRVPRLIELGTIRGRLFDLGPYPALTEGDDLIRGELWHLEPKDIGVTLDVLDEIECYGKDDIDLYLRRVVAARTENGQTVEAFTYFFASPDELAKYACVQPNEEGICRWHRYLTSS